MGSSRSRPKHPFTFAFTYTRDLLLKANTVSYTRNPLLPMRLKFIMSARVCQLPPFGRAGAVYVSAEALEGLGDETRHVTKANRTSRSSKGARQFVSRMRTVIEQKLIQSRETGGFVTRYARLRRKVTRVSPGPSAGRTIRDQPSAPPRFCAVCIIYYGCYGWCWTEVCDAGRKP